MPELAAPGSLGRAVDPVMCGGVMASVRGRGRAVRRGLAELQPGAVVRAPAPAAARDRFRNVPRQSRVKTPENYKPSVQRDAAWPPASLVAYRAVTLCSVTGYTFLPDFFARIFLGYILYDLTAMLYHYKAIGDPSSIVHHLLFVIVTSYVLAESVMAFPFTWLALGEISTPPGQPQV